jgi:uncharacterized protein (TIGR02145 family)
LANGRIYRYKKFIQITAGDTVYSKTWMTENVDYAVTNTNYCLPDDEDCFEGRFYTWTSAKASCPDGWTLPEADDYADLANVYGTFGEQYWESGPEGFLAKTLGYISVSENRPGVKKADTAFFWTKTESTREGDAYYFSVEKKNAKVNATAHMSKDNFLNVRCVKKKEN